MFKIVARKPEVKFPDDVAAECERAIREDGFSTREDAEFYLKALPMRVRWHLGISKQLASPESLLFRPGA